MSSESEYESDYGETNTTENVKLETENPPADDDTKKPPKKPRKPTLKELKEQKKKELSQKKKEQLMKAREARALKQKEKAELKRKEEEDKRINDIVEERLQLRLKELKQPKEEPVKEQYPASPRVEYQPYEYVPQFYQPTPQTRHSFNIPRFAEADDYLRNLFIKYGR